MHTFSGTQAAHPSSSNPEHPFPALTSIFTILVTTLTILHGALSSSYETNYDTQESGPKEKILQHICSSNKKLLKHRYGKKTLMNGNAPSQLLVNTVKHKHAGTKNREGGLNTLLPR